MKRWAGVLLGVVLAVVVVAVTTGGGGSRLPSGRFGSLIGCLQSHPSLSVQGPSGGAIGPRTSSVVVWGQFHGGELAGFSASGSSYVAPVGTDGMTVGERRAIEGCLS